MASAPDLAQKVAFLKRPASYPDVPGAVVAIETHMAWVFLAGDLAYKLKKPVKFEYLDFSTIELRRVDCIREVSLNRRLTSGVYLGVLPLSVSASGALQFGSNGRIVDWLVHMRRLPTDKMLDVKLVQGRVTEQEVRDVIVVLADFYMSQPPADVTPLAYRDQFARNIRANCEALSQPAYGLPTSLVAELTSRQTSFIREHPDLFDARVVDQRVIEGHGDLRPDHVCLEEPPVIFDCLEFSRAFRIQDAADELSFLAMECERLGSADVGIWIFDGYSERTRDYPPPSLVDFYKAYRACLRAKLAVWHLDDVCDADKAKWIERANSYLHLAESCLSAVQTHSREDRSSA